jgi:hypothetical protein
MKLLTRKDLRSSNELTEEPVVLKAVYGYDPDFTPDDDILDEIVMHEGEETYISKCLLCNRREIEAFFDNKAKALEAGEALKARWGVEVAIHPLGKAFCAHVSRDDFSND